jgi:hypothetical protein
LKQVASVHVISTYPAARAARSESSCDEHYYDTRADTDDVSTLGKSLPHQS